MSQQINIHKIRARQSLPNETSRPAEPGSQDRIWNFLNKDLQLGGRGISDRVKESFYLELYTLLGAGIDIRTALELISAEQKKKKLKLVFAGVMQQVIEGASLSAALQKTAGFSSYEYFSIQIGEETGKLTTVLNELAIFFQKKIRQRRQIIGALTYPVVVLVVAFGAVSFMITYVVPMFSDVFGRFGSDLPAVTKMVIVLSAFLKKYTGVFMLILSLLVLAGYWQRRTTWFRKWMSAILLRLPVIGPIIQRIYLSRFCTTMALLAGSRIPIVQAIQLTRQMITFYPIESSLTIIEEKIISGVSLHDSLSSFSIYPRKMISMIKVGEEVNQLEIFFARIAEQYAHEVEYQTSLLSKFLEPLIIVVLGVVVGVILIAMYLPLFKLGQGF